MIQHVYFFCTCSHLVLWLAIICGIKFVLLVFGSFLAFETRNINITGLNDSKYIAFSIYNIFIFCILGLIAFITVTEQVTTSYCLISSCTIICTTTTMLMLFIPKVIKYKILITDHCIIYILKPVQHDHTSIYNFINQSTCLDFYSFHI